MSRILFTLKQLHKLFINVIVGVAVGIFVETPKQRINYLSTSKNQIWTPFWNKISCVSSVRSSNLHTQKKLPTIQISRGWFAIIFTFSHWWISHFQHFMKLMHLWKMNTLLLLILFHFENRLSQTENIHVFDHVIVIKANAIAPAQYLISQLMPIHINFIYTIHAIILTHLHWIIFLCDKCFVTQNRKLFTTNTNTYTVTHTDVCWY